MKQYLLSVYTVEGAAMLSADERQKSFADVARVNAEMQETGTWVFAGGLLPPDSATVVRAGDGTGTTTMTDGPFAETKEQLGGFWVIRCNDLDEALAWADKCSVACRGAVEVRPFEDEPEG
jgi:hypothetical protein